MNSKYEKELNLKNSGSYGFFLDKKKNLCCSEPKLAPCFSDSSKENDICDSLVNKSSNSYSLSGNNSLFNSLINSKNNKNKELSLLYIINTFGKSYSSESDEKKKIIVDLPKISKNLFNSQAKCSSSKNLDKIYYQKSMPLKRYSKGGIMNSFFSSIYAKQMSSGKLITISPKKKGYNKGLFSNSGNKNKPSEISPFTQNDYQFGTLLKDYNFDNNTVTKKGKKLINKEGVNPIDDFCEGINNYIEEKKCE